ncbi:MAG: hypothetical protein AMJ61_02235 [Desulfobacterales bacterium SG8_35_2]|nr:MAG: hypothetical protein AMJ61_02235 [Desulfobacterales bacterium SG8_35_2]
MIILIIGLSKFDNPVNQPNIILIMADDMGYECLSSYGSISYNTPILDKLASQGIQISNCISQPLCTPSRIKLMTGLYNYRNYEYFGYLNDNQQTFGNLFKDAGYTTCIAGKWQLNGLAYKEIISDWNDHTRPEKFGFDEYCLWQLTKTRGEGERYALPLIEQNGKILEVNKDSYGPDIFCNYILDFIDRNKKETFFIYYPMVLVHDPFVPTPDSKDWDTEELRYKNDTTYFRDMMIYTDKIVGKIKEKLEQVNIDKNTIIIFTADNGTHSSIYTQTDRGKIQGGKGNTTDAGTHVPLIIYWPEKIRNGFVYNGLIEFSDFYPTFAEILKMNIKSDGISFYPLLTGEKYEERSTAFVHYDPRWGSFVNQYRNRFVRTLDYKLYQDGKFYHVSQDILEQKPLYADSTTEDEASIKNMLQEELDKAPVWE